MTPLARLLAVLALAAVPAAASGKKAPKAAPQAPAVSAPRLPASAIGGVPAVDLSGVSRVVFDVRGERGGNGDVAAGYLTAADVIDRAHRHGSLASLPEMVMVAGPGERAILARLSGSEVWDGSRLLGGHVKVVEDPALAGPADLYLKLAAPEGRLKPADKRRPLREAEDVPLSLGAVALRQTVFGNTESLTGAPGSTVVADQRLDIPHAGLASGEAGIYGDPIARRLRGAPREVVRSLLLEELPLPSAGRLGQLRRVIAGNALQGADVALAYGVSAAPVKKQFARYVSGLVEQARWGETAFVIVTPSSVSPDDFPQNAFDGDLIFLPNGAHLPDRAEAGKVYVLVTPSLPHSTFTELMAYSGPPPIVAGDGAMSAAIALGRPFVMTRIGWNAHNVEAWAQRMARAAATKEQRQLIADVYGRLRLERALELEAMAEVFARASAPVPVLTDALFEAVAAARRLLDPSVPASRLVGDIEDPVLGSSLLARRVMLGDPQARELARLGLRVGDTKPRRALAGALARAVLDSVPLGWLVAPESALNVPLSRLVLWASAWRRPSPFFEDV